MIKADLCISCLRCFDEKEVAFLVELTAFTLLFSCFFFFFCSQILAHVFIFCSHKSKCLGVAVDQWSVPQSHNPEVVGLSQVVSGWASSVKNKTKLCSVKTKSIWQKNNNLSKHLALLKILCSILFVIFILFECSSLTDLQVSSSL